MIFLYFIIRIYENQVRAICFFYTLISSSSSALINLRKDPDSIINPFIFLTY